MKTTLKSKLTALGASIALVAGGGLALAGPAHAVTYKYTFTAPATHHAAKSPWCWATGNCYAAKHCVNVKNRPYDGTFRKVCHTDWY